eukprot:Pgem_evm2s6187
MQFFSLTLLSAALSYVQSTTAMAVGGTRMWKNTHTWMAKVETDLKDMFQMDTPFLVHSCGASIIGKNTLLSAMHCFMNQTIFEESETLVLQDLNYIKKNQHIVNLGTGVLNQPNFYFEGKRFKITQIECPDVNRVVKGNMLNSDICLIKIDGEFDLEVVNPVMINSCYEEMGMDIFAENNVRLTAMGWGDTYSNSGWGSWILREVDLLVPPSEVCFNARDENGIVMTNDSNFCAGDPFGDNQGTCQGDSGGPLYFKGNNDDNVVQEDLLMAVSSFVNDTSINGATLPLCGVGMSYFADVSYHSYWIEQVLNAWGVDDVRFSVSIKSFSKNQTIARNNVDNK